MITVNEAARLLRYSRQGIDRLIKQGLLEVSHRDPHTGWRFLKLGDIQQFTRPQRGRPKIIDKNAK